RLAPRRRGGVPQPRLERMYNARVGQTAGPDRVLTGRFAARGLEGRTARPMSSPHVPSPVAASAAITQEEAPAAVRQAPTARPYVIAQLGQSLDGRIATSSGESRFINRECALDHLHALRASVDAVVVGVGTVLADDPRLNVRRVAGPSPARVVIDPSGKLNPSARCLSRDGIARYVVRGRGAPCFDGIETIHVAADGSCLAPPPIIEALFQR